MEDKIVIGTAAWSYPKMAAELFPADGASVLHRYAARFPGVEINSSFYRHHQAKTYARWAAATPGDFRFSVKLAGAFTHEQRLDVEESELKPIVDDIRQLGEKLAVILVQIPPSLTYDAPIARNFFHRLRSVYAGPVAFEARHKTWFTEDAYTLLSSLDIATVRADPDLGQKNPPRTSDRLSYFRLHGSPILYESRYSYDYLDQLKGDMEREAQVCESVWCIFDNTKFGWATINAVELQERFIPSGKIGKDYAMPSLQNWRDGHEAQNSRP